MDLSLLSSLTKSSEAPVLKRDVELKEPKNLGFSTVFGDTHPNTTEDDAAQLSVETLDTAALETPESNSTPLDEVEEAPPIQRTDPPIRDASRMLQPAHTAHIVPDSQTDSTQAHPRSHGETDVPHIEEINAVTKQSHTDAADRGILGVRVDASNAPDDEFKSHSLNGHSANDPSIELQIGDTPINDGKTPSLEGAGEYTDEPLPLSTKNSRGSDQTQINAENLSPDEVRNLSGEMTFKRADAVVEQSANVPTKQIPFDNLSRLASAPEHGKQSDLSVPRTAIEVHQPVISDRVAAESKATQVHSAPVSMLERHLGRLPVTMLSQGSMLQQHSVSISDMMGFEQPIRQTAGASLTAPTSSQSMVDASLSATTPLHRTADAALTVSTPLQSMAVMKSMTPVLAQGMQTAGVRVSVGGPEQIGGNMDLFTLSTGEEAGWDLRPQVQTSSAIQATSVTKTDVAGSVVQQIVDAMRRSPDKPIEIALSPVELGRVRMVLSASDAGITVNILADRPDTLDLLRRNIDDLGKSFSEMGYEDISFSFEQGDQTTDESERQHSDDVAFGPDDMTAADTPIMPPRHSSTLAIAPDGIDMRL